MQTATDLATRLQDGLAKVIVGNEQPTFALLVALLAGGHALIEGVPGTAKTLFARTLARLLAMDFSRIQFTPDLMPSDVVGTTVFNLKSGDFIVRRGPIFANVVLADEVNRTPPKTQSALLEAMEEGRVTIDGVTHPLPAPFFLCATQNPIEYEGTYPLPEAQRDRFMVRARTGYPSRDEERGLLSRVADGFDANDLANAGIEPVADADALLNARAGVRQVRIAEAVRDYLQSIVARTRETETLALGASPRASIALLHAAQA
ncbi:MAG: AAA family ATPase, partial [Vulcanimicrobiaceae bacterium]